MSLKDRFLDYWSTDWAYEDYKYDLSIFEMMIYGAVGTIAGIIVVGVVVITAPLWAIPYLVYKHSKLKERDK